MNIALGQVGPPIRGFWINLARSLSTSGNRVYFLGPSPAFERLLRRERFDDKLMPFDARGRLPVPEGERSDDVLNYNREFLGRSLSDLELRCHNAAHYYDALDIDVAVFWNDIDVEHLVAEERGVQTVFMENGYLPNTVQIDTRGVNRNASFADCSYEEVLEWPPLWRPEHDIDTTVTPVEPLDLRSKLGALLRTRGARGNLLWTVRDEFEKRLTSVRRRSVDEGDTSVPDDYVFVPLQVHDDTQILYNSPYVDDLYEFVDLVVDAVDAHDESIPIVVKEHPADVGRIDYGDLRARHPDVVWLREFPIDEATERARTVVTVNSSVGMQAIARYVPVVTVGDSFYDNNPFVEHPAVPEQVREAIGKSLTKDLDESAVDEYIEAFRERVFVDGGIGRIAPATLRQAGSSIFNVGGE